MQGTTPRHGSAHRSRRGIAIAAALSVAFAGSAAPIVAQDAADVLKVGHTAEITTWDPLQSFSTEAQYMANMYEPLVYATPLGTEEPFEPGLATDWSVSEDGLTWTFNLREGVMFSNGRELTAEDVVYTFQRAADEEDRLSPADIEAEDRVDIAAEDDPDRAQPRQRHQVDARFRVTGA